MSGIGYTLQTASEDLGRGGAFALGPAEICVAVTAALLALAVGLTLLALVPFGSSPSPTRQGAAGAVGLLGTQAMFALAQASALGAGAGLLAGAAMLVAAALGQAAGRLAATHTALAPARAVRASRPARPARREPAPAFVWRLPVTSA